MIHVNDLSRRIVLYYNAIDIVFDVLRDIPVDIKNSLIYHSFNCWEHLSSVVIHMANSEGSKAMQGTFIYLHLQRPV